MPEAVKETLHLVKPIWWLPLAGILLSSTEPHGTTRFRIVEDPFLIFTSHVFQKLPSVRVEKENMTNGFPGKSLGIDRDMVSPSTTFF